MRVSVLRPDGVLITTPLDGGPEIQQDTVQCVHCGRHWVLARALQEAIQGSLGFCTRCGGPTCGQSCQECVPRAQQLDNIEAGRLDFASYRPVTVGFSGLDTSSWKR